jgi:Flp pilus assembly protein TadD
MRWITNLAIVFVLALALQTRAAGVDDQYLDIYNHILQGEASLKDGNSSAAAQQFLDAQSALQKLHDSNPGWNPDLVAFRLQYLNDQLKTLDKSAPVAGGAAAPTGAPSQKAAVDLAESKQVIATLQQQIASLAAANAALQGKLHEALSVQPAAVDPHELARAEDKIIELQKQRDLLAASLDQEKTARANAEAARKAPPEPQSPKVKQLAKERDQLAKERDELKKDLATRTSELAAAQSRREEEQRANQADARKLQQAEQERGQLAKERDELQKKVALLSQSQQKRPPDSAGPQNEALLQQVEQLRARAAVLEANPVPYGAEELALLKQGQSSAPPQIPAATTSESKRAIRSAKDLPPGAGTLMAQGQRAAMERDYDQAEIKFNEVLRQDQNNVYVLANLASAQFAAGKLDACEKNVRRALTLDPDDSGSLYLLGVLRFRQEKLDDALDALSRSAKLNPTNAGTQNYLGCVLSDKGLRKPAETAFRKALELDPVYADAHFNLAWVYANEKPPFLSLARWHYQKALDLGHKRNSGLEKLLAGEGTDAHEGAPFGK